MIQINRYVLSKGCAKNRSCAYGFLIVLLNAVFYSMPIDAMDFIHHTTYSRSDACIAPRSSPRHSIQR